MRVGVVCTDLDEGFVFDNVGGEMTSVDASSIDPNGSSTFKHSRAWGVTVNNEGTATPGVYPRGGVRGVGALGCFAFFIDNLNVSD